MQRLCALALLACLWFGCTTTRSRISGDTTGRGNKPPVPINTNQTGLIVTPGGIVSGRVVLVNSGSQFVVISFPLGSVPARDKRLNVYRRGLKVAELKVAALQRENNAVADIIAGECQVGDEVREQ